LYYQHYDDVTFCHQSSPDERKHLLKSPYSAQAVTLEVVSIVPYNDGEIQRRNINTTFEIMMCRRRVTAVQA